jgi:hypothetical protein
VLVGGSGEGNVRVGGRGDENVRAEDEDVPALACSVSEVSSEEVMMVELPSTSLRVLITSSIDVEVASTPSSVRVTSLSTMSDPTEDKSDVTTESSPNDVLVASGFSTIDELSPVCTSSATSVELSGSCSVVEASVVVGETSSVVSVLLSDLDVIDTSSASSLDVGSCDVVVGTSISSISTGTLTLGAELATVLLDEDSVPLGMSNEVVKPAASVASPVFVLSPCAAVSLEPEVAVASGSVLETSSPEVSVSCGTVLVSVKEVSSGSCTSEVDIETELD